MRRLIPLAPFLLLGACQGEPPPRVETPATPESPVSGTEPSPAAAGGEAATTPSASYEVHEWGLVDVGPDATEIAAGPGRPSEPDAPMPVRKPVLYFHSQASEPLEIAVTVRLPNGRLLEHWPRTGTSPSEVRWPRVRIGTSTCGSPGVDESALRDRSPARPRRGCGSEDGECEVFELPRYVSADADCLDVAGTPARLLFYRGTAGTLSLPLAVLPAEGTGVVLRGLSSTSASVGTVLRIVRASPGDVRITRVMAPAPGRTETLPKPEARLDVATERRGLSEALVSRGLSSGEAAAFVNAWGASLFEGEGAVDDAIVYFLPEPDVAAIAELRFEPAPRAVRRVMMVRVDRASVLPR